jgi:hypothetical protein
VSATLRLLLPVCGTTADDVRAARRQLRDWHFNPQRHLPNPPHELIHERLRLIAESDRLREIRGPWPARREVFERIRQVNGRLMQLAPEMEPGIIGRISHLEEQLSSDAVASSREFFYCLQPADRLEMLADRLRENW